MDKFAIDPQRFVLSNPLGVANTFDVAPDLRKDLVLSVQERYTSPEFGDQEDLALAIDVCGKSKTWDGGEVLSVDIENLECVVRSIGNDDFGIGLVANIDPKAVRGIELTGPVTCSTEGALPFAVLIVAMDMESTITIGQEKATFG